MKHVHFRQRGSPNALCAAADRRSLLTRTTGLTGRAQLLPRCIFCSNPTESVTMTHPSEDKSAGGPFQHFLSCKYLLCQPLQVAAAKCIHPSNGVKGGTTTDVQCLYGRRMLGEWERLTTSQGDGLDLQIVQMLDVEVDIPISKKHALASKGHSLQKGCLLEKPLEEESKGTIVNGSGPGWYFKYLRCCSCAV